MNGGTAGGRIRVRRKARLRGVLIDGARLPVAGPIRLRPVVAFAPVVRIGDAGEDGDRRPWVVDA